jgi:hypothetical protein
MAGTKFTLLRYQQIFTMKLYTVVFHLGLQIAETLVPISFEILVYIFYSLCLIAHCRCLSLSGPATGPKYSAKYLVGI